MQKSLNKHETKEANRQMNEKLKDLGSRKTSSSNSEAEWANQEIHNNSMEILNRRSDVSVHSPITSTLLFD